MSEFLLRQRIEESGMAISVSSAGLVALLDHGADEKVIEVVTEAGVDISAHRARQLSGELVKENELILVMESWPQKEIEHLYPYALGRVHLFGKWSDMEVEDPYKKSKEAFVEAFVKIDKACEEWCKKLW